MQTAAPSRIRDLGAGLTPAQAEAVFTDSTPLCILAGAGSGKTRVLTRRVARRVLDGSADPAAVVAVTFTRKAAEELRHRLGGLGVSERIACGTFHGLAYAMLREHWHMRGQEPRQVLEHKVRLLFPLLEGRRSRNHRLLARDVASEIEWAKARLLTPDAYVAAAGDRRTPLPAEDVAAVYERYEQAKDRRRFVDFEDMLMLLAAAFRDDAAFAYVLRGRVGHLFVDEFQDVNPAQFALLRAWLGDDDPADLCVVGDDDQAIFSFSGAQARFLVDFERYWPAARRITLEDNFRSPPQVLALANALLADATARSGKVLRPHVHDAPVPTLTVLPTDEAEAQWVARTLRRERRPGESWSSMAVLVRTNAQTLLFEQALAAARVPYVVRAGAFLAREEVARVLDRLKRAHVPAAASLPTAVREAAGLDDPDVLAGDLADPERRANVELLVTMAAEYAGRVPAPDTTGFLSYLAASVSGDAPQRRGDAVSVLTMHKAKGLEFDVVVVAGLEEGLMPIGHARSRTEIEEERRLLYVALTRCRDRLHLTWVRQRRFAERYATRRSSRFLDPVDAARTAMVAGARPSEAWKAWIETARRTLQERGAGASGTPGATPTPDAGLFEALRAWRREVGAAEGVPAFCILHDSTLQEVAAAAPRTPAALLAVSGIGPVKMERYGNRILAIVRAESPRP